MNNETQAQAISGKKQFLWNLVFLAIAALSIRTVTMQVKGFSAARFTAYLAQNDPWFLTAALLMMLGYILTGALAVLCLLKGFGFRRSLGKGLTYVAADLYFSAITPSSTGGQPMEAYFMIQDGLPSVVTTVVLMTNLQLYAVSIVIMGILGLLLRPGSFFCFGPFSRVLIVLGMAIQSALVLLIALLLWKKQLLERICGLGLRLLKKLSLLQNPDRTQERFDQTMANYATTAAFLRGKRGLLLKGLLLNLLHRAAQILVTVFCFLAGFGSLRQVPDVFSMQCNVVLGASCFPIPGAMGITDYMMIDGFSSMMEEGQSANLELLSRTLSFYFCILLCGVLVLINYLIIRVRRRRTGRSKG